MKNLSTTTYKTRKIETPAEKPKLDYPKLNGKLVFGAALIIAVLLVGVFYTKYQNSLNQLKHPDVVAKAASQSLVEKVGHHIELPTNEKPTVATVSDASKLSNQTFFAKAKNGDKVLIYKNPDEAILYRPSVDKIINVASLNTNPKQ